MDRLPGASSVANNKPQSHRTGGPDVSSSAICRASALVFILFFAPLASAQVIFKCVAKDGTELYQNSACPAGSESQVVLRRDKPTTRSVASAHKNSTSHTVFPVLIICSSSVVWPSYEADLTAMLLRKG